MNLRDRLECFYRKVFRKIAKRKMPAHFPVYKYRHLEYLLDELQLICLKENIDKKDICIVGSAILAFWGVRDCRDIDFVIKSDIRQRFGPSLYKFSSDIEMVTENWARSIDLPVVSDDEIINNDKYHFTYRGFKFASIQLLYNRKIFQARPKDIRDAQRILSIFNKGD